MSFTSISKFNHRLKKMSNYETWAQWVTRLLAALQAILPSEWSSQDLVLKNGGRFDYIVVGAGSAGAIVASRLAEDPSVSVLLIEAGGNPPLSSVVPPLASYLLNSDSDWQFKAYHDQGTGQSHVDGQVILPAGKVLGGTSSINLEVYSRGVPEDYEWDSFAPGWSWKTVLPYFKKSEGMLDIDILDNPKHAYLHSADGPVLVSRPNMNWYFTEKNEYLMNSFEEIGLKKILEINGPNPYGITRLHSTLANGRRSSTAEAFLKINKVPSNLLISTNTMATKVLINRVTKIAYGVKAELKSGRFLQLYADKEIIVSAGTIGSPKLLMLSGVGPAEELRKNNITMIKNLPVGKNMHDHICVYEVLKGKHGKDNKLFDYFSQQEMGSYFFPILTGYFNVDKNSSKPQFQIFSFHADANTPAVYRTCKSLNIDEPFCESLRDANQDRELDIILLLMLHGKSRGQVTLRSADPKDSPIIELGFFRNNDDEILLAKGAKFISTLANTTYYRQVNGEFAYLNVTGCEGEQNGSDDYWKCYVKNVAYTSIHVTGTCRIGPDGVVDEGLRVHGIKNLRVADASVFPETPSGNTNAPAMMIGEFAADLIKADNK